MPRQNTRSNTRSTVEEAQIILDAAANLRGELQRTEREISGQNSDGNDDRSELNDMIQNEAADSDVDHRTGSDTDNDEENIDNGGNSTGRVTEKAHTTNPRVSILDESQEGVPASQRSAQSEGSAPLEVAKVWKIPRDHHWLSAILNTIVI